MQAQKGFTLIELIVVIVILGILASVAAPKFLDLSSDAKTASATATKGAIRSAMLMAFAKHRASGLTATGTVAGTDEYITDCDSLKAYLEGGAFPSGTSCAAGVITLQSGTSTIGAETNSAAATAS